MAIPLKAVSAAERRGSTRRRVDEPGHMATGDLQSIHDCVIRDYSDKDARLVIDARLGVPDEFFLFFADWRVAKVKVARRGAKLIAVTFLEPPVLAAEHPNRRVAALMPD